MQRGGAVAVESLEALQETKAGTARHAPLPGAHAEHTDSGLPRGSRSAVPSRRAPGRLAGRPRRRRDRDGSARPTAGEGATASRSSTGRSLESRPCEEGQTPPRPPSPVDSRRPKRTHKQGARGAHAGRRLPRSGRHRARGSGCDPHRAPPPLAAQRVSRGQLSTDRAGAVVAPAAAPAAAGASRLVCSALLCGLFRAGSPGPRGTRCAGRTTAQALLCGTGGESTARDRRPEETRHVEGGALLPRRPRSAAAPRLRRKLSYRRELPPQGRSPGGTSFAGDPEHRRRGMRAGL